MYENVHTPRVTSLRESLHLLEQALACHEPLLAAAPADDRMAAALLHSVDLLRQEAERLRVLLREESAQCDVEPESSKL
jgi:hypothetical protein